MGYHNHDLNKFCKKVPSSQLENESNVIRSVFYLLCSMMQQDFINKIQSIN